ncbi:MAG: protein-L-isoaspartate(D-aspartate) O-methyltransferase [Candidatus Accumulibacter phosphatis]|uniref:protein-L-isoaspartate(D-aspartate) O-methyltransferase n=1 Tax=Candidatus Accumulibacter phosphatis TaxID=327160 RepID=UPI001A498D41|nr:protein-L-isoaspartate(D-aspartate) O-methyltransferase [Candidatus Accumulibacter phosphatis]
MRQDDGGCMQRLLDEIRDEVRDTRELTGRPVLDPRVLEALRGVPRHMFVPDDLQASAYVNHPLPIGHGQTISQPYIVALMSDLIQPRAGDVVLEVGTGSGYQAAILARLVKQVYSLEIIEGLAAQARVRLQRLGCDNVEVRAGNGRFGWPEHAPYDSIMVTAAAPRIPPALIEQLKPGGILVMPVGSRYLGQELLVLEKDALGGLDERRVLPVAFVPLTGAAAE